ncbi:hypothetical protein AALA00_11565 [Lachnospiraceae bacterium 46-15]
MKKNNVFRKLLGMAAAVCMMALLLGMTTLAADKVETIAIGEEKINLDQDATITHYYKFQLKKPAYIGISGYAQTMAGVNMGMNIALCDAKGKVLATDYVDVVNSRVAMFGVNKGTYQIRVQNAEAFMIKMAKQDYPEKSGGTQKKAVSVKKKKTVTGVIGLGESGKKADWYKITLNKSAKITLNYEVYSNENIYIELIPSKKTAGIKGKSWVWAKNVRGKVTFQTTTRKNLPKGTYYIKVHRMNKKSSVNGAYKIKYAK